MAEKIGVHFKHPLKREWVEIEVYGNQTKRDVILSIFHQLGIKDNPSDYTIGLSTWGDKISDLSLQKSCSLKIFKKTEANAPCVSFFRESNPTMDKMYEYAKSMCGSNFSSSKID